MLARLINFFLYFLQKHLTSTASINSAWERKVESAHNFRSSQGSQCKQCANKLIPWPDFTATTQGIFSQLGGRRKRLNWTRTVRANEERWGGERGGEGKGEAWGGEGLVGGRYWRGWRGWGREASGRGVFWWGAGGGGEANSWLPWAAFP